MGTENVRQEIGPFAFEPKFQLVWFGLRRTEGKGQKTGQWQKTIQKKLSLQVICLFVSHLEEGWWQKEYRKDMLKKNCSFSVLKTWYIHKNWILLEQCTSTWQLKQQHTILSFSYLFCLCHWSFKLDFSNQQKECKMTCFGTLSEIKCDMFNRSTEKNKYTRSARWKLSFRRQDTYFYLNQVLNFF